MFHVYDITTQPIPCMASSNEHHAMTKFTSNSNFCDEHICTHISTYTNNNDPILHTC